MSFDSQDLDALLHKYSGNLPRYTSYPTALELKTPDDHSELSQSFTKHLISMEDKELSLYLHTPFCKSLCYFCACNKIITEDTNLISRYIALLKKEIRLFNKNLSKPLVVSQLHIGGGSPSYLSEKDLISLFNCINRFFTIKKGAELSIEVDPRTINVTKVNLLSHLGFNRISLGVQDFDNNVQKLINRIQPIEQVSEVVQMFRNVNISAINFDLIYGLPGQTATSFAATIEKVITLSPSRIALYGYAHVTWLHKVQNVFHKYNLPSVQERIQLFELAKKLLLEAGYIFLGLDHFVLPQDDMADAAKTGTLRRNFMGYTNMPASGVLGLGVSSISDLGSSLFQNHIDLGKYQNAIEQNHLPLAKACRRDPQTIIRADIIEKIMCNRKLDLREIAEKFRDSPYVADILAYGIKRMKSLIEDKIVSFTTDKIVVADKGAYFLRHVAACFDPNTITKSTESRFSQAL